MIIKRLECENFRQFKDKLEINFDTTGKLNIIYARNGGGKTTLHQLFKWIFYGKAEFSNDDKKKGQILYNLEYESNAPIGTVFNVYGKVEYYDERFNSNFTLTRIRKYKKEIISTRFISEDCVMMYQNNNGDWVKANKSPQEFLNFSLPESLSHYFFFDGERMISQFRGQHYSGDEHDVLKKTIYRIFDLDFLSNAIKHIGDENQYSSVLGKLSVEGGRNNFDVSVYRDRYDESQKNLDSKKTDFKKISDYILELENENTALSEKIGSAKTLEYLENNRKALQAALNSAKYYYANCKSEYGNSLNKIYVPIILAKNAVTAAQVIFNKSTKENVPPTLDKTLIEYLVKHDKCICGQNLDMEHINHLNHWLELLPPKSYINVYDNYIKNLNKNLENSKNDLSGLHDKYIRILELEKEISDFEEKLDKCEKDISEASKNTSVEEMVKKRNENNKFLADARTTFSEVKGEINELEKNVSTNKRALEDALKTDKAKKENEYRMKVVKQIKEEFVSEFKNKENNYRCTLTNNIEHFIKIMLNGERTSFLDDNYRLHVRDDFGNESLSEGQFAVVTFAYISGILKTLKDTRKALNFPLVLDGPFSKLDVTHISNVSKELPKVAKQMIIFSKDDLSNWFEKDSIGSIFKIVSNSQQNVAHVEAIENDNN